MAYVGTRVAPRARSSARSRSGRSMNPVLKAVLIALLVVVGVMMTVLGVLYNRHLNDEAALAHSLNAQPVVPYVPAPEAPYVSRAQRRAVIEQVTRLGAQAEQSSAAAAGASSPEATALHSWNAFFASHTGVAQR